MVIIIKALINTPKAGSDPGSWPLLLSLALSLTFCQRAAGPQKDVNDSFVAAQDDDDDGETEKPESKIKDTRHFNRRPAVPGFFPRFPGSSSPGIEMTMMTETVSA